jgi:hypothetical protein
MSVVRKSCAIGSIVSLVSWAALADGHKDRFIEFSNPLYTTTFDLSTVQMIVPGKFTINHTAIPNPDYMQLELAAMDVLRGHCSRPDGSYEAREAFAAGAPDLPVKRIEVKTTRSMDSWGKPQETKLVSWELPYSKFKIGYPSLMYYSCKFTDRSETETYLAQRATITSGTSSLMTFDCKRQLVGFTGDRDIPLLQTSPGTYAHAFYLKVCATVTGEPPYLKSD